MTTASSAEVDTARTQYFAHLLELCASGDVTAAEARRRLTERYPIAVTDPVDEATQLACNSAADLMRRVEVGELSLLEAEREFREAKRTLCALTGETWQERVIHLELDPSGNPLTIATGVLCADTDCPLCESGRIPAGPGPVVVVGGDVPICRDCAQRHAPTLAGLIDAAGMMRTLDGSGRPDLN